jgi:ribosomal protein L24
MLSKFTSQNGRILSFKHTNKIILKKIFMVKNKAEYRAERTNKNIVSFEVKIQC